MRGHHPIGKSLPTKHVQDPAVAVHLSSCSRLTALHSVAGVAAATVMERSVYLDLGGFDPGYKEGYWEDVDLAVRVRQAGLDVFLQSLSIFYHQDGGTFETTPDSAASLSRKDQLMAVIGAIFSERCVCITCSIRSSLAAPALGMSSERLACCHAASVDSRMHQVACKRPVFLGWAVCIP